MTNFQPNFDQMARQPFLFAGEGQMNTPEVQRLANVLRGYDRKEAISLVAGLLTVPSLQANCFRLELLVHLVAANCVGNKKPTWQHISHWLNRQLSAVAWAEDPPEDVFVSNVITRSGDFLVLGGLWETPDSATRLLIDCIEQHGGDEQLEWLKPAYALLNLSDLVLRRSGLVRWQSESTTPKKQVPLSPKMPIHDWQDRGVISPEVLDAEQISPAMLEEFIFAEDKAADLMLQSNQESLLHEKPLLRFGSEIVLALPTSVTYAVRRFIVKRAKETNQVGALEMVLMNTVLSQVAKAMRSGSHHRIEPIELPRHLHGVPNLCRSIAYRVGKRRLIHLLVMPDSLEQFALTGLLNPTEFGESEIAAVDQHIAGLQSYLESTEEIDSAHTLLLLGHLGQAYIFSPPAPRARWTFDPCRLHDLDLLLRNSDAPLDKLLLLLTQRQREEQSGLQLPNINGLPNLFAYWLREGYSLRAADIPHGKAAFMQIGTDFVRELRRSRRMEIDEHCVPNIEGNPMVVMHANSESVYESVKSIPVFASITHLEAGVLGFCLTHGHTTVWVTFLPGDNATVRELAYKLWKGMQILVYRALTLSDPPIWFAYHVVEVIFDMRNVVTPQEAHDNNTHEKGMQVRYHREKPIAKIAAEAGFLRSFSGVGNHGEKTLLAQFIRAFRTLAGQRQPRLEECEDEVTQALGGDEAKIIHAFETYKPLEFLLSNNQRQTFRRPDEHVDSVLRSAFSWRPSSDQKVMLDLKSSGKALNNAVTYLMHSIVKGLSRFNREAMVVELLHAHETLIQDKSRWRNTARAVRGLYGVNEGTDAAEQREKERSQSTLTLRALVEAAICECPAQGGVQPDGYSVDELFGLMCALIELGRDSETIYHGMASAGISIYPNGGYSFDADVLGKVGQPYTMESFRVMYAAAAANYENWVTPKSPDAAESSHGESQSPEFLRAFEAEYKISFDHFLDAVAALLDVIVERNSVVTTLTKNEIVDRCLERGLTEAEVEAMLVAFALPSRPTWQPKEPHAYPKDVEPWSFGRRLSVMLRPIIECHPQEPTIYAIGAGTFRESIAYVLDSIFDGRFDDKGFSSSLMRSYIGARNEALGYEFTRSVADHLIELGWQAETELLMTKLGASKNPNLGDIDVLAWAPNGQVLAIECKRLKKARTVSEIALTCNRFRGYANDRLAKHLGRVSWLEENRGMLAKFTGLPEAAIQLRAPLVTSAPVPFRYLQDLPINPEDILHFGDLHQLAPS
ncbi:MAG: hypothetical protein ACOYBR_10090 [Fluviibacter sp.]